MPRRRNLNIGCSSRESQNTQNFRRNLLPQQQEAERENARLRMATTHELRSDQRRTERLENMRSRIQILRNRVTDSNRSVVQLSNRVRM